MKTYRVTQQKRERNHKGGGGMKYKIVHGPKYGDHSTWFEQFSSLYSVFEINEDGSRLRVGSFVSMKAAKNYIKKITPMGGK